MKRKNLFNVRTLGSTGKHIALILLGAVWMYPFLWMLSASFKTNDEFWSNKFGLIPQNFTFDNIERVWTTANFGVYFLNTVIITIVSVILVVIMTNLAGYALGRYSFVGKKLLLGVFLASIAIPQVTIIIPVYYIVRSFGLIGTRLGVILASAGGAHVIFLLLYSSYYRQIPNELEEAAKIDGCGFFRTYFHVLRPLARPITCTVLVMETIWTWNAFMLPLVLTYANQDARTLAVGLYAFQGENVVDWTGIAAGGTIAIVPIIILYVFLQKYFVNGIAGAVKD